MTASADKEEWKLIFAMVGAIVGVLGSVLAVFNFIRGGRVNVLDLQSEVERMKQDMANIARKEEKVEDILYSLIAFWRGVLDSDRLLRLLEWSRRNPKAARPVGRRLHQCLLNNRVPGLGASSAGYNNWLGHLETYSNNDSDKLGVEELAFWGEEAPWGAWMLFRR
jgi:hypothetical protein